MLRKAFVRFMQVSGSRPVTSIRYLPKMAFCSSSQDLRARALRILDEHGISSTQFSDVMDEYSNAALKLLSENKFAEGIEIFKGFIELSQRQLSKDHEYILKYKRHLAKVQGNAGMWEQSAATLEGVAEIEQAAGKQVTPGHIETLYLLEMAYNFLGREEEAKKCSQKAAQFLKEIELDVDMMVAMVNIARIYFRGENFDKSLRFFRQSYSIWKRNKDKPLQDAFPLTQILLEIINVENIYGDMENAAKIMQQVKECLGGLEGQTSDFYLRSIENLLNIGKFEQAEKIMEEALRILPRQHHSRILLLMLNSYTEKKDVIKTEATCRAILQLLYELEDSSQRFDAIRRIKVILAPMCLYQGKSQDCEYLLQQALNEYFDNKGTQFVDLHLQSMKDLADFYSENQKIEDCQRIHKKILEVLELPEVKAQEEKGNWKYRGVSLLGLKFINMIKQNCHETIRLGLLVEQQFSKQKYAREIDVLVRVKHTIAQSYFILGQQDKFKQYWQKYYDAVCKYSNMNDLIYAEYLQKVALIDKLMDNLEGAVSHYKKAAQLYGVLAQQDPSLASLVYLMERRAEEILDELKAS